MDFKVSLAQIQPMLGNLPANLDIVEETIQKGIDEKSDIIVFPELALTGYFLKDLVPEVALRLDSHEISRFIELSRHISIVLGFVEVTTDYHFYNSALYLEAGEIRSLHRKVYLPTYGLFDEQRYLARGERFRAFDTSKGRFGLLVCEDMWHLSAPYILAMDGATSIFCLSSSPARGVSDDLPGSAASWQKLNSSVASFFTCHVIYCNRTGFEDGISFWGGSEVVAPDGKCISRAPLFDPSLITVQIKERELRRERITSPLLRDENLPLTLLELERIRNERGKRCLF